MTRISIHPEERPTGGTQYRAVSGKRQSTGRTAGEALDALNAQSESASVPPLVVVQQFAGDAFFSEAQHRRMQDLLSRRESLTPVEQDELDRLVREELVASAERTKALADALGR